MIIITGAAGFIGSNLIRALNAQGRDDIICVDDLTDGRKCANLSGLRFQDLLHKRDVFDEFYGENDDIVVHLGANTNTREMNGDLLLQENTINSQRLLSHASVDQCSRFIYASSAAVYGNHGFEVEHFEEDPANERPVTPYGFSKWLFDNNIVRRARTESLPPHVIGLRFFNVYGPGERHKDGMASFAHRMLSKYLDDPNTLSAVRNCNLFEGSDKIFRDFVYIDDVVKVLLWAIDNENVPQGIYNVGTGTPRTFVDVADMVDRLAYVTGRDALTRYNISWSIPAREYQAYTVASLARLRAAGYTASFMSLEEGMQHFWYNWR